MHDMSVVRKPNCSPCCLADNLAAVLSCCLFVGVPAAAAKATYRLQEAVPEVGAGAENVGTAYLLMHAGPSIAGQ